MDFSRVKQITIPQGNVKQIKIGNTIVWKKVQPPQVSKGDILLINLDGTTREYRVIKVDGNAVEILALFDASTSQAFGSTAIYENSLLDTFLNDTWYNTLTSQAKNAIVDKSFRQESWAWFNKNPSGSPLYYGKYGPSVPPTSTMAVRLDNANFGNLITRHVYALGVQDVLDYLECTPQMTYDNTTLLNNNIWKMFWNDEASHADEYLWLNSIVSAESSLAFYVNGNQGYLNRLVSTNRYQRIRVAFQIDLSKIEWQKKNTQLLMMAPKRTSRNSPTYYYYTNTDRTMCFDIIKKINDDRYIEITQEEFEQLKLALYPESQEENDL